MDRFEHWNKTAPYPLLISDLFVVDYDEQGRPKLSHLNANAKRFELTEWSGEFVHLRDRFERRSEIRGEASAQTSLESFAEDIPALIIPFRFLPTDQPQSVNPPLPSGFTIIKLDLNYLQREFIPSLIQRHLFDDSRTEYNLAVISIRHPEQVIYSSRYPLVDFSSSDVSTRIFGLEGDELRAFLRSEAAPPAGVDQPPTRQLRLINLTVIDPNLPPVKGDGAALKRAMQNLISNAVKYDRESRWARIGAQMWTSEQGNEVRITVEDRGLGISSADIAHIFEPFYRGHEAVAGQIKGSGVGLVW